MYAAHILHGNMPLMLTVLNFVGQQEAQQDACMQCRAGAATSFQHRNFYWQTGGSHEVDAETEGIGITALAA